MIKKLLITSLCSLLTFGVFADTPATPDTSSAPAPTHEAKKEHKHHHGNIMANLTDEQKACIEKFGCKMPEMPKGEKPDFKKGERPEIPNGERPDFPKGEKSKKDKKPEMTEEQKENFECIQNAMKSCDIEMPKEHKKKSKEKKAEKAE